MANDKDFIVKNAVEVGKDTKVTLGTITSSDIDLSTGNYFSDTLAANTTYTISNAGDVQSFQLEVTSGGVGYNIAGASYDSVSFSAASQDTNAHGVTFNSDGTKMYVVGAINDSVYQYTLTTGYDVSTASYDSVSLSVASQDTNPVGLFFKSDGTKLYVVGLTNDNVYQYSLSTAFDLSTASYDSVSFSVASQDGSPHDVFFKSDGTRMFITGNNNDSIFQYTLSTAWDLSTASYDSVSFDLSSQDAAPISVAFKSDGTKMYIAGAINDAVYQYSLSTSFDLSTASYDNVSFSFASQTGNPYGLAFNNNGTKMYIVDITGPIYQYSTSSEATLTWPSSIEWAGGVAPAAPATGETDVFTITTDDGGTTYTGVKTADNLS